MDIILNQKKFHYYTTVYDTDHDCAISMQEPGQYSVCMIAHNTQLRIQIHSTVPHTTLQIVVISYTTQHKPVSVVLDGHTDRDYAVIDMTLLSLAAQGGVLDIQGAIHMPPGVAKTQGYLLEENIILHPTARMKILPKLDIRSHDVQASHGAKIHTIDAIKLFYMQARGLSLAESKKLYVQSYIQALFDLCDGMDPDFATQEQNRILDALAL